MSNCNYLPPNKKSKKSPYSCPECKSDIRLHTEFSGYDMEDVDRVTGEFVEGNCLTERVTVFDEYWRCCHCNWQMAVEEL